MKVRQTITHVIPTDKMQLTFFTLNTQCIWSPWHLLPKWRPSCVVIRYLISHALPSPRERLGRPDIPHSGVPAAHSRPLWGVPLCRTDSPPVEGPIASHGETGEADVLLHTAGEAIHCWWGTGWPTTGEMYQNLYIPVLKTIVNISIIEYFNNISTISRQLCVNFNLI